MNAFVSVRQAIENCIAQCYRPTMHVKVKVLLCIYGFSCPCLAKSSLSNNYVNPTIQSGMADYIFGTASQRCCCSTSC
uniref:Mitochondrial outer membrane protein porin 2-like n=1 Tax=Rhizophora mucronata TaxID=61149 RepID=A0A2P2IYU9_RHIMU